MDRTLSKGLKLLEVLARNDKPRGVTSLANELALTKSNVHRLVTTLASEGFVRRADSGSYELTLKIWELGVLVRSRMELAQVAGPSMARLAQTTGESVHLSILDGLEVVYIDKVESSHPIAAYTRIGGRAPAWCVATGKAMLAFTVPMPVLDSASFEAFTSTTITSQNRLDEELASVRESGVAINRGEWRPEVFGIASPIQDATGSIVGALGISGPESRFAPDAIEAWAHDVFDEAAKVSNMLGFKQARKFSPIKR